jgi:hypothetical protein
MLYMLHIVLHNTLYIIGAVIAGVWCFRSAQAVGKSTIAWAAGGVVAFLVANAVCRMVVRAAIIPWLYASDLSGLGVFIAESMFEIGGVALGLALAYWIRKKYLRAGPGNVAVADTAPAADSASQAMATGTAEVPKNVRNMMQVLFIVALIYAIAVFGLLMWIASMGARALPFILFAAIIVLYIMVMRFASARNYGKATGYMIAAGIVNLPLGIIALIVGILTRRAWKNWVEQQPVAQGEVAAVEGSTGATD